MPKLVRNWKSWDDEVKKQKKGFANFGCLPFCCCLCAGQLKLAFGVGPQNQEIRGKWCVHFLAKKIYWRGENKERTKATPKPERRSLLSAATLQRWAPFYRKSAAVGRGSAGITREWGRGRVCKLLGGRRVTTTTCWATRGGGSLAFRRGLPIFPQVIGCLTDRLGCWKQWRKRHHDKHNADLLSDSVHII